MNILIVDDEQPARERLRQLIDDLGGHSVIGEAANGHDALTLVTAQQPDVVLLDIRMPGLGGLETARHLDRLDDPPAVIFTTAYDEYAMQAFDAHAVGYVLKPVRLERLRRALGQAQRLRAATLAQLADGDLATPRSHLCARLGKELKLIPVDDVLYFHADQKYVRVRHTQGDNLIDDSLKFLEAEFTEGFVRIHRSVLVAIAHIESLEKQPDGQVCVRLRDAEDDDADSLTISRRHLPDVRRRLKRS